MLAATTQVSTTLVPAYLEESSGQPNSQNNETPNNKDKSADWYPAATETDLRSPSEVIEPAVWIEQLSVSQLTLLARGDTRASGVFLWADGKHRKLCLFPQVLAWVGWQL